MGHRFASALLCASVILPIVVVSLMRSDVAMAQVAQPKYEVTGFREARFGMTEQQVRLSAKSSFGVGDGEMTLSTDTNGGNTKLVVHVRTLEPGLGEGRIVYLFGYKQHKLVQVNVVWGLDTNPPLNNIGMIAGAVRLQRYFSGFAWATRSVRTAVPIDDRAILLFSGADAGNGAVFLVAEQVRYELVPNGIVRLVPELACATRLTISYESSEADMREINRREF
jgi:hypothetical protein